MNTIKNKLELNDKLIKHIEEQLSAETFATFSDLRISFEDMATDLIENYSLLDNFNRDEALDMTHEWADSQVDIYYNAIYASCATFSSYVEEAFDECLLEGVNDLSKIIQAGQYHFWEGFAYQVVEAIDSFNK